MRHCIVNLLRHDHDGETHLRILHTRYHSVTQSVPILYSRPLRVLKLSGRNLSLPTAKSHLHLHIYVSMQMLHDITKMRPGRSKMVSVLVTTPSMFASYFDSTLMIFSFYFKDPAAAKFQLERGRIAKADKGRVQLTTW